MRGCSERSQSNFSLYIVATFMPYISALVTPYTIINYLLETPRRRSRRRPVPASKTRAR